MLGPIKRFFARPSVERESRAVSDWAGRRGHVFRRARGDAGFVIEGVLESLPWRLEWGPAQRPYIGGRELRLRMELGLPSDQQMLLLSRPLLEALERQTYEQFTGGVQTQAGGSTPEEMRWLVMFPKVELPGQKAFAQHFGVVASQPAVGLAWVAGPLANLLLHETDTGLLRDDPPLVLMTLRGRAYLRMRLEAPEPGAVAAALGVFETAVAQAVRVAADVTDTSDGWTAGATSAWQSLQPGEEGGPRKRR